MIERSPRQPAGDAAPASEMGTLPRDQWLREDDELLLLDELVDDDEAPDDERSDGLL